MVNRHGEWVAGAVVERVISARKSLWWWLDGYQIPDGGGSKKSNRKRQDIQIETVVSFSFQGEPVFFPLKKKRRISIWLIRAGDSRRLRQRYSRSCYNTSRLLTGGRPHTTWLSPKKKKKKKGPLFFFFINSPGFYLSKNWPQTSLTSIYSFRYGGKKSWSTRWVVGLFVRRHYS